MDKCDRETQRAIDIVEGRKKPRKKVNFFCFFGVHKWHHSKKHMIENSNVWDTETYCTRCGKYKRYATPRK